MALQVTNATGHTYTSHDDPLPVEEFDAGHLITKEDHAGESPTKGSPIRRTNRERDRTREFPT
jgi:hypothetical protein